MFAFYYMVLNRSSQKQEKDKIGDEDVYDVVMKLCNLLVSCSYALRIHIFTFVCTIILNELPERYLHKLVSNQIFAHLSLVCDDELALETEDVVNDMVRLIINIFRRSEIEKWQSECIEVFLNENGDKLIQELGQHATESVELIVNLIDTE